MQYNHRQVGVAMNLKETRIRNFLSIAKLADKANVSVATVRDVEAGKHRPTLTTCRKLAAALGMSPDAIHECREIMEALLAKGRSAVQRVVRR